VFNDLTSPLKLLETRRSAKPRDIVAPGPNQEEIERILRIATRVPDHGNLTPWRFVLVEDREAFADLLEKAYISERPGAGKLELKAVEAFSYQAPTLVVAISKLVRGKIPLREQRLSMGAAILNLQLAAIAMGYVTGWLTGWAAYSDIVLKTIGDDNEEIAGFLFLGSASRELEERRRPVLESVLRRWPYDS